MRPRLLLLIAAAALAAVHVVGVLFARPLHRPAEVLAVLCLLVAGMLRSEWAYGLGWAIQVAAVALGFWIGLMFFLGAVFAALWATAYLLGRKIERDRAAAFAAYDAEHAGE